MSYIGIEGNIYKRVEVANHSCKGCAGEKHVMTCKKMPYCVGVIFTYETANLENLIDLMRGQTFHMDDKEAGEVVNRFIEGHPELLELHDREWYNQYI